MLGVRGGVIFGEANFQDFMIFDNKLFYLFHVETVDRMNSYNRFCERLS